MLSKKINPITDLLVHGYIHKLEKDTHSALIIPEAIYKIIALFYPQLLKFELFDSNRFELLEDGYEIKGKPGMGCSGYTVFPESLLITGYNKGIHYWSVKLLGDINETGYCYHSIGIIANERDKELCNKRTGHWAITGRQQPLTQISWFDGYTNGWNRKDIITIKLDCDKGITEYWKNDKKVKKDEIDTTKSYYFAMNTCCIPAHYFKVVETPLSIK